MTEEDVKIIHNEHELMTALTMFFAVFWSGEKKFSKVVIRSREGSVQAQTRVSLDFRENKELWNMVIQDYLKSGRVGEERNSYVREQIRLLLGGSQKKRYQTLLDKMLNGGIEIEEDIAGSVKAYFAIETQIEESEFEYVSKYRLLERDGKFVGKAFLPDLPDSVSGVVLKVVRAFQEEKAFGRVLFEFVYLPQIVGVQEERVVMLGSDTVESMQPTIQETISEILHFEVEDGELMLRNSNTNESSVLAFLLDGESLVQNESMIPSYLRDLVFNEESGRGVVFSSETVKGVVPEGAALYLASGQDSKTAFENLKLLYTQVLDLSRDLRARQKLLALNI